jgi:hypothetical protein
MSIPVHLKSPITIPAQHIVAKRFRHEILRNISGKLNKSQNMKVIVQYIHLGCGSRLLPLEIHVAVLA